VVGRAAHADVRIKDPAVSCFHCSIFPAMVHESSRGAGTTGWFVGDLGSRNGTYLNGVRVRQPTRLADQDIIQAGRTQTLIVFLNRWSAHGKRVE
jgi:pSer/pThr/pTyr-binding forkhead associated (FHA) protein